MRHFFTCFFVALLLSCGAQEEDSLSPPTAGKDTGAPTPALNPTIFIHGHGNDTWAWEPMIQKVKGVHPVYLNGAGFYAGDALPGTLAPDTIFNFGYYKEHASDPGSYPEPHGKIGGIKLKRFRKVYEWAIAGQIYTVTKESCAKLWVVGANCDPTNPIEQEDGWYATSPNYAQRLAKAMEAVKTATGASKVNIVAHSMGGLVARAYIKWLDGSPNVGRLLLIGTPNHGVSDLAEHTFQYGLLVGGQGVQPDPLWMRNGEDFEQYPKTVDEYHFDHAQDEIPYYENGVSFLQHLNEGGLPPGLHIATIAGTNHDVQLSLKEQFGQWWLKFFGVPAEWPDDTAVNVKEVQLAGAEFNLVLDKLHGRMQPNEPFLGVNDPERFLTESQEVAKVITSWVIGPAPTEPVSPPLTEDNPTAPPSPPPPLPVQPYSITVTIEDGYDLSDWTNPLGDLDVFHVVQLDPSVATILDPDKNGYAIEIGGTDEGGTWVGEMRKTLPSHLRNWTQATVLYATLVRGPLTRGGWPSVTLRLRDEAGRQYELHRPYIDQCLPWSGGGSRIVGDLGTPEYGVTHTFPIPSAPDPCAVQDPNFDWHHVMNLSVELRRSMCYVDGSWVLCSGQDPDDLRIPYIGLVLEPTQFLDADADSIHDWVDKCPTVANKEQVDTDHDGLGDVCDNCPANFNPKQEDLDKNGKGDACQAHVDIMLEDAEDISDWWLDDNKDLDLFTLSDDAVEGKHAMQLGGTDVDEGGLTWVGVIIKPLPPEAEVSDWSKADGIKFWARQLPTPNRGGIPAITFVASDANNTDIVLHRDNDLFLPWEKGGWRTSIENPEWTEILLPIRHEGGINWSQMAFIRIEVRRSILKNGGGWIWDKQPDDFLIDSIRLDPPIGPAALLLDIDEDGVADPSDNCPGQANADQLDANQNSIGDACEIAPPDPPDKDGDGILNEDDPCPTAPGYSLKDFCPGNDVCPDGEMPDDWGDPCDRDADKDGMPDLVEAHLGFDPLAPHQVDQEQLVELEHRVFGPDLKYAQTFTEGISCPLVGVGVDVAQYLPAPSGATASLKVTIHDVGPTGHPTQEILTKGAISTGNAVVTGGIWYWDLPTAALTAFPPLEYVAFSGPVSLIAGKQYALVLSTNDLAEFRFRSSWKNRYLGGDLFFSYKEGPFLSAGKVDMTFQTLVGCSAPK